VLYEAQLGTLTRNSRLIHHEPHGYTSPVVHSHYVTEPVTVGSAQHSYRATQPADGQSAQHLQCIAEPVDQESALHTFFSIQVSFCSASVVCDIDLYYFHISIRLCKFL